MIITVLKKVRGFYSILFFVLNHYLYSKRNKINYRQCSHGWLFKTMHGWTDYFNDIILTFNDSTNDIVYCLDQERTELDLYTLHEYKEAINDIYQYNETTKQQINEVKTHFYLFNNYSSIFIRRGDKLRHEADYYHGSLYIKKLLEIEPTCQRVFIQTDDYHSVLEIKEYLIENQITHIEIITICDENTYGMVITNEQYNWLYQSYMTNKSRNMDYLSKVKDKLLQFKPVEQMTPEEIYDHTIRMLIGVDIVLHSTNCITDYWSNISRFIKIAHDNSDNVYDINDHQIDFNIKLFPAHPFP
jgi:hypothetical protein